MKLQLPKLVLILLFCQFSFSAICQDSSTIGKAELRNKLKKVDTDTYEAEIYSGFFNTEVKILIQQCSNNENAIQISDCLLQRINDFITYEGSEKNQIRSDIFSDYHYYMKETYYAMVPEELLEKHNNNYEKANQEYFNINTEEEAIRALQFQYASFIDCAPTCELSESKGYYSLVFERPWDDEHSLEIEFEQGKYKELF
jgi:hypothetical protein